MTINLTISNNNARINVSRDAPMLKLQRRENLNIIKSSSRAQCNGKISKTTKNGVMQGCVLSPKCANEFPQELAAQTIFRS